MQTPYVKRFPTPTMTGVEEKQLAAWAEEQLALQEKRSEASSEPATTTVQQQIDALNAEIDAFVYKLYGLDPDEIALVEAAAD